MADYYDDLETRAVDQREQALIFSVGKQLINAKSNAAAYAGLLSDYDCESFASLDDLESYPVTRKAELADRQKSHPPLGGFTTFNPNQIRYINVSPGPIYEACTHQPDFWRLARALFAAGFRSGDLVHNSFSYHLTPAGMMLDSGCHALGCGVIPGGVGQTEMQVRTIHDLKPDAYVGTPSFLKKVLEKAEEIQLDISSIGKGLVSGEALPPSLRSIFKDKGIAVLQAYATADLGVIGYETIPDAGLILDEDVYVEIVRPGTGDRVMDGEVGEVVVTSLNSDYPLIRFATGDMSAFMTGVSDCGRTNRRIKGWMGRADQTAKVRGMFIHPQQINDVVRRHPEITKARLVVDWIDQQDEITLYCESKEHSRELAASVEISIRDLCKVRGDVALVAPGTIVNDGVVIEDNRKYE